MNERIKQVRKSLKLSQEEFALRLGISGSGVSNLESGRRGITDQMILAICREYNVNEEWLRTGSGDMFIHSANDELSRLANEYALDALDCKIIESYMRLSKFQRQAIKRFIMDVAEQETTDSDEKPDSVRVFTAAKSDDNREMGYSEMSRSDMEKLRKAPDVDEI